MRSMKMDIKIEKNIPMPTTKLSMWRDILNKMEIGHSIVLEDGINGVSIISNLEKIRKIFNENNWKVITRTVSKNGEEKKIRIWRGEDING
jgi:hypothetical protein